MVSRTPEEDSARSAVRSLVKRLDGRVDKVHPSHVQITPCPRWPEGLITAFNGWVDLLERLRLCDADPELVTDGIYVQNPESIEQPLARQIQRELRDRED